MIIKKKPDKSLMERITIASDNLVDALNKSSNENQNIYREHMRSLIESDFVNVNVHFGDLDISIQGKREGFPDYHALVIRILQEIGGHETAYASKNGDKKDVAYG